MKALFKKVVPVSAWNALARPYRKLKYLYTQTRKGLVGYYRKLKDLYTQTVLKAYSLAGETIHVRRLLHAETSGPIALKHGPTRLFLGKNDPQSFFPRSAPKARGGFMSTGPKNLSKFRGIPLTDLLRDHGVPNSSTVFY